MPDTQILKISADALQRALAILRVGGVIAFPTDTVYGLCCDLFNDAAVARIYQLKGRPSQMPLIAMIAEVAEWTKVARSVSPIALRYMNLWWPGPLTIIIPARVDIPEMVLGGGETIGIRIPDNGDALELLHLFQQPLATTSANISGHPAAINAQEVQAQFAGQVDLILDAGQTLVGLASTVVDCSGDRPIVLREGPITREMLALEQK